MSSRLSLKELIGFCTRMRHSLGAGLSLTRVFNDQAKKGPPAVRALAGSVATELESGSSLHEALAHLPGAVPPLMLSLIEVGETTGMLPEVFAGLEKHFQQQQTRWRQFWAKATWPLIQLIMAVFVLAGLILVLGMLPINQKPGGGSFDPLGLGLRGTVGAMIFLGVVGGIALMAALSWRTARQLMSEGRLDFYLLKVPMLGPCLRALAMSRFCMALGLTHETAMPIGEAVQLSLKGTGNEAFASRCPIVGQSIRAGDDLTYALTLANVFPPEFLEMISIAEVSGTLTEVMERQAAYYEEEADRSLANLTAVAGYGVWGMVAIILIFCIFRLAGTYLNLLNQF